MYECVEPKYFDILVVYKMSSLRPAAAIFFNSWVSSASYRVRIALHLKDIEYVNRPIDLNEVVRSSKSEQVQELKQLNPMGYLPVLKIDGVTLIESMAIMEYLDERHPNDKSLLPAGAVQRAQARAIANICVSGIQPLQNLGVLNLLGREYSTKEKKLTWAQHWINKGFGAAESYLRETSGRFCVGDDVSIADLCLVPQVFNARKFNVDMSPFPTIVRIDHELNRQEAFMRAHPFNQEDFPAEKYPNQSFFDIYKKK